MRKIALFFAFMVIVSMLFSGCAYSKNRYYDFRDIFDLEAGATFAKPKAGIYFPQGIGLYAEATKWLQLGAIYFNNMESKGGTAGLDLRSTWVGKEARLRYGVLWWQKYLIKQEGKMDKYKANSYEKHGIDLCYRDDIKQGMWQAAPSFRGKNYWEFIGLEAAISEPFLLHAGVKLRAGIDPCQIMDFLLGFTTLDIYGDDLEVE